MTTIGTSAATARPIASVISDKPGPAVAVTEGLSDATHVQILTGLAARKWPGGRNLFHLAVVCGAPAVGAIWLVHPAFEYYGAAQRVLEIALAAWTIGVALHVRRPMEAAR